MLFGATLEGHGTNSVPSFCRLKMGRREVVIHSKFCNCHNPRLEMEMPAFHQVTFLVHPVTERLCERERRVITANGGERGALLKSGEGGKQRKE